MIPLEEEKQYEDENRLFATNCIHSTLLLYHSDENFYECYGLGLKKLV